MEDRDTVPAMPVPSKNPTAEMRAELEAQAREATVAIMQWDHHLWRGVTIEDGLVQPYTPFVTEELAREWLDKAKAARRYHMSAWLPTVCARCMSLRTMPSICDTCMKSSRVAAAAASKALRDKEGR